MAAYLTQEWLDDQLAAAAALDGDRGGPPVSGTILHVVAGGPDGEVRYLTRLEAGPMGGNRSGPGRIAGLVRGGHEARAFDAGWTMRCGGMQAVAVDPSTGVFTGAADPRRDGYVATP